MSALATVPDHVAGVLRVVEYLTDTAAGPGADAPSAFAQDRVGWRVPVGVKVEPASDLVVAEPVTWWFLGILGHCGGLGLGYDFDDTDVVRPVS
jgi:hypothetical protein